MSIAARRPRDGAQRRLPGVRDARPRRPRDLALPPARSFSRRSADEGRLEHRHLRAPRGLFEPVHDELLRRLAPQPGERWLVLATGRARSRFAPRRTGPTSRRSTSRRRSSSEPSGRRRKPASRFASTSADVEYLPYDDASFDVLASDFGLDLRRRPRERRGRARAGRRPGARLGFTAWKPSPKLGELYRRFTEEPIEGREAYEWGREDHVEDDARRGLRARVPTTARSGSTPPPARSSGSCSRSSAPPVVALLGTLDEEGVAELPPRVRRPLRGLPRGRPRLRAAALPAHAREAALSEVAELLRELIRVDTSNPPGNETAAAELLRSYLEQAGVECELLREGSRAREPRRAAARLRRTARRSRCSRTPTSFPPTRASGAPTRSAASSATAIVWGRGALDMKGQVAASAVAIATLAREGWRPRRRPPLRRGGRRGGRRRLRPASGSCASIPTRCAPTTRSTRAAATASRSRGACSTSARPPRR